MSVVCTLADGMYWDSDEAMVRGGSPVHVLSYVFFFLALPEANSKKTLGSLPRVPRCRVDWRSLPSRFS